jgi:hypothetical protein
MGLLILAIHDCQEQ